ncbi:D-2-hydroxyacid dehydrogenase [Paenibacillus eucommiae]|nr:D-2-hydroxyacid dehydrogenase [Paenibacillus eucommiae]
MKIVVLDGYTLNPGDLDWGELEAQGELIVHDRTSAELIVVRLEGAEIVLTNKTPITAETINALPKLRYIGVLATGYNIVDVEAAVKRGIPVANVPTYGTVSVAQFVLALLLELCHHIGQHSEAVHAGEWSRSADFTFSLKPLIELHGKTIGLIGYGRIGQEVAKVCEALGMKVLATTSGRSTPPSGTTTVFVPLEQLLAESDVVSLHCPLLPSTQGLINKERLSLMKPTAFLINTSRGPLVVEQDLADALAEGRIGGAGLDVLSVEPPNADNPLLGARNCIITPHMAWATKEARGRLLATAAANLRAYAAGSPVNIVNKI